MRTPLTACFAAAFLAAAPVQSASAALALAPATSPGPDRSTLAAFETGFKEGQDLADKGQPAAAARRWKTAADLLPETTANREMRAGIYEYIAIAYTEAVTADPSLELVREASIVFDEYIAGYTRSYGTETPPSPKLAAAQKDLADRRARAEAAAGPAPVDPLDAEPGPAPAPEEDPQPSKPTTRPWKPLVITGGVLLGVGALTLLGGAYGTFQSGRINREYNSGCDLDDPDPDCQRLFTDGKNANAVSAASFVAAGVLIAVGIPLLVVGMKRKKTASNQALLPVLGPTQVGLHYTLRF